jgi:PKD repeat protein
LSQDSRSSLALVRRAALGALAILSLAGLGLAQYATIQRDQKISALEGGFSAPIQNDYRLGVSVCDLGDFDGDGIHDLVVGGHRANIGGPERGAVWLCFMNADGTVRSYSEISSRAGGLVGPLDDRDRFGVAVCALGDLDHDGTTDLAVGAYRDDDGDVDAGAVYILFLTPQGTVKGERKISATSGGLNALLRREDSFGWSLENLGDFDGDGVIDLAVGATRDDGGDTDVTKDYGAVYFLFLNADGTVKSHTRLAHEASGFGAVLRPRDRFGADVVVLGDPDQDGVTDVAVGAFGEDPLKYGRVFVLHLTAGALVKDAVEIGLNAGGFTGALGHGDRFGTSLAADDFDGDGLLDLAVGAPGDDDGGAEAGALWVLLLNNLGRVKGSQKISPDIGGFSGLLHPGDNFGISCATVGDLDRDGAFDLAVGAYQDDDGGFDRGALWILFREGTGAPVADFVASPSSGEAPFTVSFTDRSTGTISTWSWDFGDGASSTAANPVHTYTLPGTYNVSLSIQGPLGSDTFVRQRAVVVLAPSTPQADFLVNPARGSLPLSVTFTDASSGTISAWSWDFGDGAGSTLRYPKHLYVALGSYTVSLTVTGSAGMSQKVVAPCVEVLVPPPIPDFEATPTSGTWPLAVAFTDRSSADTTSWSWDFGDGTGSAERSPVHTYLGPGLFSVALTAGGAGGTQTLTRTSFVTVTDPLTALFDVTYSGAAAPVTVQFNDRSLGGPTQWSWDFGDGGTSTLQSPSHRYDEGGLFAVRLTVTAAVGTTTTSVDLLIQEPPPDARFSVSTILGALPLSVRFTDRSTGNITSWLWDFGDGTPFATERSPTHLYWRPGTFTVRLRVESAGGVDGVVRNNLITVTNPWPKKLLGGGTSAPPVSGPLRTTSRP